MEGLPLSRWSSPALTGVGRLPMAPALAPYDDIAAAERGEPSPWVRSLDGTWRRAHVRRPRRRRRGRRRAARGDGWTDIEVPGTWVLQDAGRGHGTPIYLNIRMPFDGQAPDVPADNPTAVYRRRSGSRRVAPPPHPPARRRRRLDGRRVGEWLLRRRRARTASWPRRTTSPTCAPQPATTT